MHQIKKLESVEALNELRAAAAGDSHCVMWPTHVLQKDGETVGYVSVCSMPVVNVWVHSQKTSALENVRTLKAVEAALRANGITEYVMPCADDSPFFEKMQRLGFSKIGQTTLFVKRLDE